MFLFINLPSLITIFVSSQISSNYRVPLQNGNLDEFINRAAKDNRPQKE